MRLGSVGIVATLTLSFVFGGAGTAQAQPSRVTRWSLEVRIAGANAVVVGPIAKVNRKVVVPPGKRYPDGQFDYAPAVKIEEVFKGDVKGIVDDLQFQRSSGEDRTYEQWMKAGNKILWFLGPAPKPGKRRAWEFVVFGKEVPAEARSGGRREPPLLALDFTVLKDEKAILDHARQYAKTSTKILPSEPIRYGPPWHDLMVPVEPALEPLARRLIASPQDFIPKGEKLPPRDRYQLRFGGVKLLRHFKAEANIALLKSLLGDPLEKFESSLIPQHPVRVKAFEVLLGWGVDAPLPNAPDEVSRLDLAGTAITDAQLKRVAELKNLAALDLENTKITAEGLKNLAGLKKLTWLELRPQQVTDATLRGLREIGLLHALSLANPDDRFDRPRSVAKVTELELWKSPVTDAGLKELAQMKNLTFLDLRATQITDTGLKELAGMTKLTHLLLKNTRVTKAGVAELQKVLPKCKISQ